ncbi:MAG: NusG domain II-containing protein [Firmicutes bacterium]|nr:NusG domain II-containing protein [Bacillota bacterium]
MHTRRFIQGSDLILIAVLLLLAGLIFLAAARRPASTSAQLVQDSRVIMEISLGEDQTFSPSDFPEVTLEVKDGRIRFLSSDCPDQTCVRTGFISHPGEYAVCLPKRLMLRIPDSPSSDEPDAILK